MRPQSHAQSTRYRTLDGLRGVGALSVVLLHFGSSFGIGSPAHGYLAVDLFFCLSGFVLTRTYTAKIEHGMGFSEWIAVRLIRLYPVYILSIALGAAATCIGGMAGSELAPADRALAFVTSLVMVPSPTWRAMPEMFPLNFVAWSLFIEMLLSSLFFWSSRWSERKLWSMLAIGAAGLILSRFLIGYIGGGFAWRDAPLGFARGLFGFTAGILIGRHDHEQRITTQAAWLPIVVAALLMSIRPPHATAYDLAAILFVIPAITWCAVRLEPRHAALFSLLGDLSYPVYALHSVSLSLSDKLSAPVAAKASLIVVGCAELLFLLVCCWLIDRYYDRPVRKWLSRMLRQRVIRLAAP